MCMYHMYMQIEPPELIYCCLFTYVFNEATHEISKIQSPELDLDNDATSCHAMH